MLNAKEKIEIISNIIERQAKTFDNILNSALRDSNIDTDSYGEIIGIAREMASIAIQQKEERDALFDIVKQEPTA